MKYLKLIVLAALAAMALMATAASPASAATVCSTAGTGESCGGSHGKIYTGPIVAKNVGNVVLTVTNSESKVINTVTCTSSEAGGSITNGETGEGDLTKLTFTSCSSTLCSSVSASTTASTSNPWASSVRTDSEVVDTNGIMTTNNVTGQFTCTFLGFPVTCKYKASAAETTVDGSDTEPKITANNVTLENDGNTNTSVCGTDGDWTGTYKITTPSSLFII